MSRGTKLQYLDTDLQSPAPAVPTGSAAPAVIPPSDAGAPYSRAELSLRFDGQIPQRLLDAADEYERNRPRSKAELRSLIDFVGRKATKSAAELAHLRDVAPDSDMVDSVSRRLNSELARVEELKAELASLTVSA